MKYAILYRGELNHCVYTCGYCPFKKQENPEIKQKDKRSLEKFVLWVERRQQYGDVISVFFTPRGEALTVQWYRRAIITLSHMAHIEKVAIQTNLCCSTNWFHQCDCNRMALWVTYHPGQVTLDAFLKKCTILDNLKIPYSIGVVGVREHIVEIAALRNALPANRYLWVNAYNNDKSYYTEKELDFFRQIDFLFDFNHTPHNSRGQFCQTGQRVFSVDGDGVIKRCFFTEGILGNIYTDDIPTVLRPRTCPEDYCRCFIGYVHLETLGLYEIFGNSFLERIPLKKVTPAKIVF